MPIVDPRLCLQLSGDLQQPQELRIGLGSSQRPLLPKEEADHIETLTDSAAVGHASDEESVVRAQSHLLDEPQNLLVEPFATSQEGVTLYPQAPRKSSDRYARLLASAGRGFPLWIPEAHRNLPSAYRRTGVRIGDVGIITSSGSFSFLFNIFAPIVDPIHPSPLPEEFTPLRPAPSAGDVRLIPEFRSGSYLASSSVEKLDCDSALGLSFKMSASEGAILTIPEGATSADLEDLARIRKYAAANLLRWYRYVNGPRGRDARNGEIRIVIGCDKSASWGTATMTNDTPESNCQLKFRPLRRESGTDTAITAYTWEHSGRGETRVGPDVQEVEELRSGDPLAYPNCKYQNQCLFLRTMNPILGDEEWLNLCYELDTPHLIEPRHTTSGHDHQNARRGGKSTSSNSASGAGRSHPYRRSGGTREYALFGGPPESGHPPTLSVSTTASPEATPFHPSEAINRALLKKAWPG
ncbi:hypothetical protein NLJ89_g7699 [Agrocybe chaxingu]|uniref:Uncharacterized protein n=1 Tax=Agrocybe chaxingu TaxID=84603 RepID=A0A9W8MV73_9AGAR|nr:hypothetical protein NLJ89_g7699 [Agrocybe chaxingu]